MNCPKCGRPLYVDEILKAFAMDSDHIIAELIGWCEDGCEGEEVYYTWTSNYKIEGIESVKRHTDGG